MFRKVRQRGRYSDWQDSELIRLISAVKVYGRNWTKVIPYVGTRDRMQIMNQAVSLRDQYQRDSHLIGAEILPQLDLVGEQ